VLVDDSHGIASDAAAVSFTSNYVSSFRVSFFIFVHLLQGSYNVNLSVKCCI